APAAAPVPADLPAPAPAAASRCAAANAAGVRCAPLPHILPGTALATAPLASAPTFATLRLRLAPCYSPLSPRVTPASMNALSARKSKLPLTLAPAPPERLPVWPQAAVGAQGHLGFNRSPPGRNIYRYSVAKGGAQGSASASRAAPRLRCHVG